MMIIRSLKTASNLKCQIRCASFVPSFGFDVKYTKASASSNSNSRPVAIMAGWLGATERQMKPYLAFYHDRGIDTISYAVGPLAILFPQKATEQMENVLNMATKEPDFLPSAIIVHHFSVGGYLYGQALRAMKSKPTEFGKAENLIAAQIFDSPPDLTNIARGMSLGFGLSRPMQILVEKAISLYLVASSKSAGLEHKKSSAAFRDNHVLSPSLWFFSKSDKIAPPEDCQSVIDGWNAKGIKVEKCVWDKSPHIQHGRLDPDRYFGTLDSFLKGNLLIQQCEQ